MASGKSTQKRQKSLPTAKRKGRSRAKTPVKVPPKGKKCERVERDAQNRLLTKAKFHKGSFRYVQSGDAAIIVGCPIQVDFVRGERAGRTVRTTWKPDRPIGQQCVQVGTGKPVGLRAHAVLVPRQTGKPCKAGYKPV